MKKYMSNEEFSSCHTIDYRDFNEINEELERKNIHDLSSKIEYVKENYDGQRYMYFVLRELNDVILTNYHEVNEEYRFSKDAIDRILRAFSFATMYMQDGLPEHAYDYIKSKSSVFFHELLHQYKENEQLKDI